ncbi:MAG: PepSY domain-containing protein [Gammaproteobacteria bacterium]|nr:PepSY domain-containing protein [Gammaproteobacteria bacterium]
MRQLLRRLHRWIGLILGAWIVLLGLTGSALVYREELENWQTRDLPAVIVDDQRLSLQMLADSAGAARPDQRLLRLRVPSGPAEPVEFMMISPGARDLKSSQQVSVYVDPYNGRVIGYREHTRGLLWWMRDFHFALFSGVSGLRFNGIAASALVLLGISGLSVWWPGWRWRSIANSLRLRWRSGGAARLRGLHVAAGAGFSGLLIFIALTALYFNVRPAANPLLETLLGTPRPAPTVVLEDGGNPASLDDLLAAARTALPQALLYELRLPPPDRGAPATMDFTVENEAVPRGNRVWLHPQSAEVLRVDRHGDLPRIERLYASMAAWHFGSFGGGWTRFLWFVAGLVPLLLWVSGTTLWLRRRRAAPRRKIEEA